MPIERLDDCFRIPAAKRLHEHGSMAYIARGLHLCHGHRDTIQIGISDFASRQDFRKSMAQQFANPQLTL